MAYRSHEGVLVEPAMEALNVQTNGRYIDGTYGRGGHASALAGRLGFDGRLWLLDRDPEAVADAQARFGDDPRCSIVQSGFEDIPAQARDAGVAGQIDGVCLDLGVSSPQFDDGRRGFSFRNDGPLDMRMDPTAGETAYQWLLRAPAGEIRRVIRVYGEQRHARRVTDAIVSARGQGNLPNSTSAFAELIREAMPAPRSGERHPATKVFQAIRIHINNELAALDQLLAGVCDVLAPGGRLVIISFHSLEDRRVKRFMRDRSRVGELPPGVAEPPPEKRPTLRVVGKPVRPTEAEVATNPRSRSAVMRVAERRP